MNIGNQTTLFLENPHIVAKMLWLGFVAPRETDDIGVIDLTDGVAG